MCVCGGGVFVFVCGRLCVCVCMRLCVCVSVYVCSCCKRGKQPFGPKHCEAREGETQNISKLKTHFWNEVNVSVFESLAHTIHSETRRCSTEMHTNSAVAL